MYPFGERLVTLEVGMTLNFYSSVISGLKLKVKNFHELIPTLENLQGKS